MPTSQDYLVALRRYFALTQHELGLYLGLSRTLLAHVEAGRRTLPLTAMRRLVLLLRLLPPPHGRGPADAPALPPTAAEQQAEQQRAVRRRLAANQHEASNAAYRLQELREQAGPLRRRRALPDLLAALPPDSHGTPDVWPEPVQPVPATWPELLQLGADDQLPACGQLTQGLLEARLAGLAAEAAHLNGLLAGLPPA